MKKLCIRAGLFVASFLILLSGLEMVVNEGLRQSNDKSMNEWNEVMRGELTTDVAIIGSSRARMHISPKALEDELGMSVYNLGFDGQRFRMQMARYDSYRKYNTKPKMVIQTLDTALLIQPEEIFEIGQFFPYLEEPIIAEALEKVSPFNGVDRWIPCVKYRMARSFFVKGLAEGLNLHHYENDKYKGYQGRDCLWDGKFEAFQKEYPNGLVQEVDQDLLLRFDSYLAKCQEEGIEMVLVFTPEYIEGQRMYKNRDEIIQIYQDFADKYDLIFLDYSSSEISMDRSNFYNSQHMNKKASEEFSAQFAQDLALALKEREE